MAHENGFRGLDGRPLPPVEDNMILMVTIAVLFGIVALSFIMATFSLKNPAVPAAVIFTLVFGWVCKYIKNELAERKSLYEKYLHDLDVYNRRKAMVINNGGRWKTDQERYREMFVAHPAPPGHAHTYQ